MQNDDSRVSMPLEGKVGRLFLLHLVALRRGDMMVTCIYLIVSY
jgi:hypothetical protein